MLIGARIGSYEVLAKLGEGGMGEVYRARDVRLNREVALKILPEAFTLDPDRLARFKREAQVLASLNHPNVGAIYGFEESDGVQALVLELVEGTTLADRLARGPIPTHEALALARQIAEALEAAHDLGIVHRDLKPANVKVRDDGTVKVLDFGLAKLVDDVPRSGSLGSANQSVSPTISLQATYAGVILGTAAYMSPEQARGRVVDRRADVWAFGCLLFEMLSGARAFDGDDIAETIGAVIHKEPPWARLPGSVPHTVRVVLERCLEKHPKRRIRDIGDVQLALTGAFDSSSAAAVQTPARSWRPLIIGAIAGSAFAVAVVASAGWLLRPAVAKTQPVRFTVAPPAGQPFNLQGFFRQLAISPDGTHIVYAVGVGADSQLMIRAIDQLEAVPLRGVTGGFPFFSSDSRWIGFFTGGSGELKKVSVSGGVPITICRYLGTPRGGSWSPDGTIVFATNDTNTGLLAVSSGGGEPKVLTTPDTSHGEQDHWMPAVLPGGRAVLFTISSVNGPDNAQVAVLDRATGQRKTLIHGGSDATYVDAEAASGQTGYLVYGLGGALRAVPFDLARLTVKGDPVPIIDSVVMMQTGATDFSVSREGTIVYFSGSSTTELSRSLVWMSRDGTEKTFSLAPRPYTFVRLSPDESRIALAISDQANDIWTFDLARGIMAKVTEDPNLDVQPIWSPDGKRIVFVSSRSGAPNIYSQASDGSGIAERLTTSTNQESLGSFAPDGRLLMFQETGPKGALMVLRLEGAPRVEPVLQSVPTARAPELSPDGKWIAYYSNESGQNEVFVRPFPNVESARVPISAGGGSRPVWSKDGKELFYLDPATAMMAVSIQTTPTFKAGTPKKLFDGPWYNVQTTRPYDVARDGQRFVMIKNANDARSTPAVMTIVLNWTEELKARVPLK